MNRRLLSLFSLGLSLLFTSPAGAQGAPELVGNAWTYQVKPKETLSAIAARYHLDVNRVRAINGLKRGAWLHAGQVLHLSNRRIVPRAQGARVVINIPELTLYRYEGDHAVASYPVALGQPFDTSTPEKDPKRWQTPTGTYKVVEKRANPVWNVPTSIQEEMAAEGKEVKEKMAAGPDNPLGKFWIGLSLWGYGIHGTIAPSSVGRFKTHGCIRMRPGQIDQVFNSVKVGETVRIVYDPVKVTTYGTEVWLEVTPDTYHKVPDMQAFANRKLSEAGVKAHVDPARVAQTVRRHWGVAVRVDKGAPDPFSAPMVGHRPPADRQAAR